VLVVPEDLVRGAFVEHRELRASPPDVVELVGQRPSAAFSPEPFQTVSNGLGDRLGLRPSPPP
jgi:hypothetical protein